jgi:phage/plasmid-like protein (TIGR03299 family)
MPTTLDPSDAVRVPWRQNLIKLDNPSSVSAAITKAGLDWGVGLRPLYCAGEDRQVEVKDRYAICRLDKDAEDPSCILGLAGRHYSPVSNREAFGFLDPLLREGSAKVVSAGALRGGKRVFMQVQLPGEIRVTPDDVIHKHLIISNSHDGSSAIAVGVTPIRLVCSNQLAVTIKNSGAIRIRHYPDAVDQVKQAARVLGVVEQTYDRAGEIMRAMVRTPMNERSAMRYFESVLPDPEDADDLERERLQQRRQRWLELFETGDGNQMVGVRGTAFAGLQGLVQWADRESFTSRNKEPAFTVLFGAAERIKRRGFEYAARLAGAYIN